MILYDYTYDFLHQPFRTRKIDSEHKKVVIKITVPGKISNIAGVAVKLSKAGNSGHLGVLIGNNPGCGDIASGSIQPCEVMPVYEAFVKFVFPEIAVAKGQIFYLTLRFDGACKLPMDGYRLFGPAAGGGFDEGEVLPYWWDPKWAGGMSVPSKYKPGKYPPCPYCIEILDDGSKARGYSLLLLEDKDQDLTAEPFSFMQKVVKLPYTEWELLSGGRAAGEGETMIDNGFAICFSGELDNDKSIQLADETQEFLLRRFGIIIGNGKKKIVFAIADTGLDGTESHTIDVSEAAIIITGKTYNALLSALRYVEDIMEERRAPVISNGHHIGLCKYPIRMTNGFYPAPAAYFVLQYPELYTDGYMWRLSRAGYNAIWLLINVEELVEESVIFPEMRNENASIVLERLKRITEAGALRGVDVYFELRTGYYKPFSSIAYEKNPDIASFTRWGNYPCTGSPKFREFLYETLGNAFRKAPLLKGMMLIYDTEGFYSCFLHNMQKDCPVCGGKSADELAVEFLNPLNDEIKKFNPEARLIAWTYYCEEPWNYRLLQRLSPEITVLACYSQFMEFERFGVKAYTDDYSCCVTGPSDYFQKVYDIIKNSRNMQMIAKTEVSFGEEFVTMSYDPCMRQHQRRWDSLAKQGIDGFMGDYLHRGFYPSPCTDLLRRNIFITRVNDFEWLATPEDKLKFIASQNYSCHSDAVLTAWDFFSRASSEYFPFSPGVCRYPGPLTAAPSQPFYLDKNREIKHDCSRFNTKDLAWTEPYIKGELTEGAKKEDEWDVQLVRRCFAEYIKLYDAGISELISSSEKHGMSFALRELLDIAEMQTYMCRGMVNFIDFITLRDAGIYENVDELFKICLCERDNSIKALKICERNSSIGFSGEGQGGIRGGYFNVHTIQEKLDELEDTIIELIEVKSTGAHNE